MELVCGYVDPRNHLDVGLGPPFRDPECWRGSRENRRDMWETDSKAVKTQQGREMGQWIDEKRVWRIPKGVLLLVPSSSLLKDSALLHLHELCEKLQYLKINRYLCKFAWAGFCSCNQIISKTRVVKVFFNISSDTSQDSLLQTLLFPCPLWRWQPQNLSTLLLLQNSLLFTPACPTHSSWPPSQTPPSTP